MRSFVFGRRQRLQPERQRYANGFGRNRPRCQPRGYLGRFCLLAELGLITVEKPLDGRVTVARLTARGEDVARGRATVPGVKNRGRSKRHGQKLKHRPPPRRHSRKIGQLRQAGKTIDEILEKLKELDVDVSRSALGRHCKQLEEVSKSIRQSRIVAEALAKNFGDEGENKVSQVNIELMHSLILNDGQ